MSAMMSFCVRLVLACIGGWIINPAAAQVSPFPDKEIHALIGFAAGSSTETSLRALAQVAEKYLGKSIIIINKPGASQAIALSELARSNPDAYTIGVTTDGFRSSTRYQQAMNFEPDDLKVLLGYARFRHVLFVKGDAPYSNIADFVAAARKDAKKINYGGTGQATTPFLLGRLFFGEIKADAAYVPFKGTNELVPAVLGGHIVSGVNDISTLLPYFKSGELKPLLVFGRERLEEIPDVPTSMEKGYSNDLNYFNTIIMVVAPKDAPSDRLKILTDAFRRAAQDPQFTQLAQNMGLKVEVTEPEMIEKQIAGGKAVIVPILKSLGLFVE
jgi:tripartite-type tricarboxylate transporter receptor subunit TctC